MPSRHPRVPSIGLASRHSCAAASSRRPSASSSPLASRTSELLDVGEELVQRRVEQADGDGQAVHRLEDALEVGRAAASRAPRARSSSSTGLSARITAARAAGGRRGTCARCGRGRCPRRRTRRATCASCGRSALVRTLHPAERVGPAEDGLERTARVGRDDRRPRRSTTSPVVPLIEMTSPSRTVSPLTVEEAADDVDLRARWRRRPRACPCRGRRRRRGSRARRAT